MIVDLASSDKKNLITKANVLIEANYKLGLIEQKIILCLASNIQPSDHDFKTYTLPIKEFNELLGLKGSPKYTEIRSITKNLMQKVFELRIDNKLIQVSWLSYVAYNHKSGTIELRFDPFLKPYLLKLKREFTSYRLENIVKLRSTYSIRIYELLKQYEKLKERVINLDNLRELLGAEDIYPAYGNFKQRILLPAQKELKEKTDIEYIIEEIKIGRKVKKLKFIINSKQKGKNPPPLFEEKLDKDNTFFENVRKVAIKQGLKLTDDVLLKWEKYGEERVINLLKETRFKTNIQSPIAYITWQLKKGSEERTYSDLELAHNVVNELIVALGNNRTILPEFLIKQEVEEVLIKNELDFDKYWEEFSQEIVSTINDYIINNK